MQKRHEPSASQPKKTRYNTKDRPHSDRPRSDRPRSDRPRSDRPRSDRPRSDRPHSDRLRSDRPRSDRPRSVRPRSDRSHSDRPRSDRPHSDRPHSDRPHSEERHGSERAPNLEAKTVSARQVAYRALKSIYARNLYVDVALEVQKAYATALSPQDRAFARWLTAGVVRYDRRLENILERFWKQPPPEHIQIILRMGALQLLLGDNAHHAAVSETVSLCGKDDEAYRGMVNGILRNIIRADIKDFDSLSPLMEFPKWMLQDWKKTFGDETAEKIALKSLKEADMDISLKNDDPEFLLKLKKARPLPGGGARLKDHKGRINKLKGYKAGAFWVQDAAAQIPVKLLGDIQDLDILDLCAAPGGKSLQMATKGANVTAIDIKETRMQRLLDNFARMQLPVQTEIADVLHYNPEQQFDIVMLDAPCSATGTLRRHPEILRHRKTADIEELATLQKDLLEHATTFVKDSGKLVYVTCSLQYPEGAAIVNAFLNDNPQWKLQDPSDKAKELKIEKAVTPQGYIHTHPALWEKMGGMDGFFVAILQHIKNNES